MKILLDTDIGSDIDDAVCLAYLLAQPACDLVGITTVTGEGSKRAMLASALCKAAGRDVPIYLGAEKPLWIDQGQPKTPQADALARWPHDTHFPTGEAVEFMRRTIRQHPGEITLLTIGPLTNIALLFSVDPAIPALLNGLVMMNGYFIGPAAHPEWNISLDPHAAAIVYRAAPSHTRAVGLDVTLRVTMSAAEVRARFVTPLLLPVRDFADIWFKERSAITFHDPLAAVALFNDDVCGFERGQVTVGLDSAPPGKTYWRADPSGPHEIAVSVAVERFFEHFFAVFDL